MHQVRTSALDNLDNIERRRLDIIFDRDIDMDLADNRSKGNTQLVSGINNTSSKLLPDDNRDVRGNGEGLMAQYSQYEGGKLLRMNYEPRVMAPNDEDEMRKLQTEFANLNPKSPQSPPNLEVETEGPFSSQGQLDIRSRTGPRAALDARFDPRGIPRETTTKAFQPTDAVSGQVLQSGVVRNQQPTNQFPVLPYPKQTSQVQVVSSDQVMTPEPVNNVSQIQLPAPGRTDVEEQFRKFAESNTEQWKTNLIQKILRQFQKIRHTTPVLADNDLETALGVQKKEKEKQFRVKVVPEETAITISDDSDAFLDLRPKPRPKPTSTNVHTQPELPPLNCQPSSTDVAEFHHSSFTVSTLDGDNYLRKYEFLKGHVLPGTRQSLGHLLTMYSTHPGDLAIGCHGILTTQNNRPTELGEYEEVDGISKGYQFVKVAGHGSYGKVLLCKDNLTQVEFVKKEILRPDRSFLNEVRVLSELNHKHLSCLYGFILRDGTPEILMEYAGVSLMEYITSKTTSPEDLREEKIIELTYQGLCGLEYLDQKGIIHYDIKPENLCVLKQQNKRTLKITDFGSAKKATEQPDFMGCTVEYLSPELGIQLIQSKYQSGVQSLFSFDTSEYIISTKSDIFAFALSVMFMYRRGHVVISLFNDGKMSYNGLDVQTTNKLRQTILVSLVKNPTLVKTVLIPDACCSEMKGILKEMSAELPSKRPSASELKDMIDDFLNRRQVEVPYFVTYNTFTEDKHVNLSRQLSSRSSTGMPSSSMGPVRNNVGTSRRFSREKNSLPYGYQKVDKNVENLEVESHLQAYVPNFSKI